MPRGYLQTGQRCCYNRAGSVIACAGTAQDGELRQGLPLPAARFAAEGEIVHDLLTGLTWSRSANLAEFPLTWQEALDFVAGMNREGAMGHGDWRLPNRRELRSLVHFETKNPALPPGHPFVDVVLNWYWTATTAANDPAYAWYVHLEGARMFYGRKDQYSLVWPVRGESAILPATGWVQELRTGLPWPSPRFAIEGDAVLDRLTGLRWHRQADLTGPVSWPEALAAIVRLNRTSSHPWRLPNINELESLTDCSRFAPALPALHPFTEVRDVYWASTTSFFEPDWAWALYLDKGATGVGVKGTAAFHVWPVS